MLNDLACKSLIAEAKRSGKSFKKFDRNGLYLLAKPSGQGCWYYKYRIAGKEKKIAFGPYPAISLAEARDKHHAAFKVVTDGKDPSKERQKAKEQAKLDLLNTFELVGKDWFDHVKEQWSENHAQTIERRLNKDLYPSLGHRPIKEIDDSELLSALQKIEKRGSNEIARRNLQYASNIFRHARRKKLVNDNPAEHLEGALKPYQRGHFPSMTLEELPLFLEKFERNEARLSIDTREAMELLMLTLLRTKELLGCEWSEVYIDDRRMIIPGRRMKRKKGCPIPQDHIVPLSNQAFEILMKRKKRNELLDPRQQSKFVFPSYKGPHKHLHNRTVGKALERMGYLGIHTGHGFRALGMGIAKEKLGYAHEVIDRQLAHVGIDELKRSYDRAKYLPQRELMMQEISDFVKNIWSDGQNNISEYYKSSYQVTYFISSQNTWKFDNSRLC